MPFNYDPDAPPPFEWLAFLNALWPNDSDSIKVLQEWFGYVLSGRTDLHKIALMIGPPRSGRGTIARILEAMIGKGAARVATDQLARALPDMAAGGKRTRCSDPVSHHL